MQLKFAFAMATVAFSVAASAQISGQGDATSTTIQDEVDLNNTTFPDDHVQTGNSSGFNKTDSSTLGPWSGTFGNGTASGTGEFASASAQYAAGVFTDELSAKANLTNTGTIFADSFDEATSYAQALDQFTFTATSNEALNVSDVLTGSSNSPFTVGITPLGSSSVTLLTNGESQATYELVSGKTYTLQVNLNPNPMVIVENGTFHVNQPGSFNNGLDVTADFGTTPEPFTMGFGICGAALFVRRRLRR